MITKIDHDYLLADLASVEGLLSQLTPRDFVIRISLESRKTEILAEIEETKNYEGQPLASASLFFSGKPVNGSRGIESDFGAAAIASFQDIVAKVSAARRLRPLKRTGKVPHQNKNKLHITRVVHGSFGFQFEEIENGQPRSLFNSNLKESVDQSAKLLASFDELDDETFGKAVEDVNTRVLKAMRDFFELVEKNEATFRLVSGSIDKNYDKQALGRAVQRAQITTIKEITEHFRGRFGGVLPEIRTFEFRPISGSVIHGKIASSVSQEDVLKMNEIWANKDCEIKVETRHFLRQGEIYHTAYFLLGIKK